MTDIRIIEIVVDHGPAYIKDGPRCYCGKHDWIIKPDMAVCSYCASERKGHFTGYISKDGPKCYCGNEGWLVSTEHWICSYCASKR